MEPVKTNKLPVACFAPALTDEGIAGYRSLVAGLPLGPVKDALGECLRAVDAWWALPESTRTDVTRFAIKHRGKDHTFAVTPLEEEHVKSLWDLVPWGYELDAMQRLFDDIPAEEKRLRDAAFHLLWHVKEMNLDREPSTIDKL